MMGAARRMMPRVLGIGFWKLCGSGTGEGFTPVPNTGVYAILATWPDHATAERQTAQADVFRRYARHAAEVWTVFLTPVSARGAWAGENPFRPADDPGTGPLAALTRATLRPARALRFWRRGDTCCLFAEKGNDMVRDFAVYARPVGGVIVTKSCIAAFFR